MRPRLRTPRRSSPRLESLEPRLVLTAPSLLTVPMDPALDQFGDQILTVQAYGDASRTTFGIFDTGASAVTFSPDDQAGFALLSTPIPILNPGGAQADGIGGGITGDVSQPGTILADGMHAATLTIDPTTLFPDFTNSFTSASAATPGIQAFVGTPTGSPSLPTITGTPILGPSSGHPNGLAARIDMQGATFNFSDLVPGLTVAMPDLNFVDPGTTLVPATGTTDPIQIPLHPYGSDNQGHPGTAITEAPNEVVSGVGVVAAGATATNQTFLFDTGAQLSVVSTATAQALGLNLASPDTTIEVQGVGGTQVVPGFIIPELDVPRSDGGTLQFTNVPIFVLDVAPGIDGILGMNLFNTASSLLFDPNNLQGPTLGLTFFTNPDRSGGFYADTSGLSSLLGSSFAGSVHGKAVPGLSTVPVATGVTIDGPTGPATFGQSETFTATVKASHSGVGTPAGSVTFKDGATVLQTVNLVNGTASFSTSALQVGQHAITAVYAGGVHFAGSTSPTPAQLTVSKASSSTILVGSISPTVYGQPTTFTATVSGVVTPKGSVTFLDGTAVLGTAGLNAAGVAKLTVSSLAFGTHSITASYGGDPHFLTSTSTAIPQVVNQATTATVLASTITTSPTGRSATFKATVTAAPPGTRRPSGSVTFLLDGTKVLAVVALDARGNASFTAAFNTAKLPMGSHTITAIYKGNLNFKSSSSTAVSILVN